MATVFTHSLVGGTLAYLLPTTKKLNIQEHKIFYMLMFFLPIIPDFDYIGFIFRVPYDSLWGHRGITHSILFSALLALMATFLMTLKSRSEKKSLLTKTKILGSLFIATISHAVLDSLTNGGLGVAFFSPFNAVRYFSEWRPIKVSPLGMHFFSERGFMVLVSEFYWIWIPCLFLFSLKKIYMHYKYSSK